MAAIVEMVLAALVGIGLIGMIVWAIAPMLPFNLNPRLWKMRLMHQSCANCKHSQLYNGCDSQGNPEYKCRYVCYKKKYNYSLGQYVSEKTKDVYCGAKLRIGTKHCHWEGK